MSIYGSSGCCSTPNICQLKTVRLASTTNIVATVSGNYFIINQPIPYQIDGVDIELNDLILIRAQTDTSENGVYVVSHLEDNNIILTRSCLFNPKCCNYKIFISEGDTLANSLWYFIQNKNYKLGDPIVFIKDGGGGGGDITNGLNVGGGEEVFKQKVGDILEFRTLIAGANILLTQNDDTIEIAAIGSANEGRSFNIESNKVRVNLDTAQLMSVFTWDQSQYSSFVLGVCTFYAEINVYEITVSLDDPLTGNLGSITTAGTGIYTLNFTLPVADTFIEIYVNREAGEDTNQSMINGMSFNFYF